MRRVFDYEDQQALTDAQEADLVKAQQRLASIKGKTRADGDVVKEKQLGEGAATAVPLAPRPWLRSVPYTRTGMVAVPKKPYHQQAQLCGAGNIAFEVSYSPLFLPLDTIALPGDRDSSIKVFAGQELWMRSQVINGFLSVIVEPYLGDHGQTLHTKGDGLDDNTKVQ